MLDPESQITVALFNPRMHLWSEHFKWTEDHIAIVGLTATGRATISRLKLNRTGVVNIRRALQAIDESGGL